MEKLTNNQGLSFALLEKDGVVTRYLGRVYALDTLDQIEELRQTGTTGSKPLEPRSLESRSIELREVVFLVPYHSIREKGFEARGEEPILALVVDESQQYSVPEIIKWIQPVVPQQAAEVQPSVTDEQFTELVEKIQQLEIEGGNATQVILSRVFSGSFANMSEELVLSLYRSLLQSKGQYMTICFADRCSQDKSYFIGATPERHLEITRKQTIMNPIAGTLRKEDPETFTERLRQFVVDDKEIGELFQVLDEELKMMARVCPRGGTIQGPFLREIGAVVHSEYRLIGLRASEPIDALRHTLHAPTLVGGPLESAARIIAQYEPDSRRYYGGEIVVLGPDDTLDSSILIRCAEISATGEFRVRAGAGVVRDSVPELEMLETWAKAQGMLRVLKGQKLSDSELLTAEVLAEVSPIMARRNKHLSKFLFETQTREIEESLVGKKVRILDNEDNFAYVFAHMADHLGCQVIVQPIEDYQIAEDDSDVLVLGPGPGDPNDKQDPRMCQLRAVATELYSRNKPLLGVCLGHQALALTIGLEVTRQSRSTQGVQLWESIFGEDKFVGFYNSFSPSNKPTAAGSQNASSDSAKDLKLGLNKDGRVIWMQGENFIGLQFHPESVMTEYGYDIITHCLKQLVS